MLTDAVWPLSVVGVVVEMEGVPSAELTAMVAPLMVETLSCESALSVTVAQ